MKSLVHGNEAFILLRQSRVRSYLRPDVWNVQDAGGVIAVAGNFSGARLFFVSRLLKLTKSVLSTVFQALVEPVNSRQPDSHVSIIACVGAMSMPFCESGPRTV